MIFVVSCSKSNNIKIGFVSDLSGRNSALAIPARNSVIMAIDKINLNGGINGRQLTLVLKDNKGDVEVCRDVVNQLLSEEVDVIIGPLMSSMAQTVIDTTKDIDILIISPTVSSDAFTGIDDNFFRTATPASTQGLVLAKAIKEKKVAIVLDSNNSIYTDSVSLQIEKTLPANSIKKYYFADKSDFPNLLEQISAYRPESIVFISSGIDAASIIQQYKKINNNLPKLYGSSWIKQSDILSYGGKTVEGMTVVDSHSPVIKSDKEKEFFDAYNSRFGYYPILTALYAYETILMYKVGAENAKSLKYKDIKETLLNIKEIKGLRGSIEIDNYGDGKRIISLYRIVDNKFILLKDGSNSE